MADTRLTPQHFYRFFQCPHWIWYDIYGDSAKRKEVSPLMDIIYKGKLADEPGHLRAHKKFEELKPEDYRDLEEAYLATLERMREGKNIYHGVLMHEEWAGMPDLLEARPGKSELGPWEYAVYDIQRSLDLRDEHKFPLVFYSLILERIQGVRPREAFVIDPQGNERSFLVDDFIDQFHLVREEIERILDGTKPPPFLKSGCKRTPWYSVCLEETEGCNDVSLIYRLSQADQRRLYGIGIRTVQQLADSDPDQLQAQLESWPYDKVLRFHNQARVLISREPMILRHPEFPDVKHEVYFDVEGDPTRDVDYLFGLLTKDTETGRTSYKQLLAKNPEEEKTAWREFLDMLSGMEDFAIYHYAYYERKVFDQLVIRHGAPSALIQKFNEHAVDLHAKTVESVVLPLYFYTLKDLGKYLGYEWTDPEAGGAESVVWYDQWLKTGDRAYLDRIITYNEDDVRATMVLKEWLESLRPKRTRPPRQPLPSE
ncbi:MAG TPA: TM0106 family RecB-like putative nuclease [Candidatus Paceibacterota bacterium]|nr:TM0106 family RecB-like putative nuclease [Candidatus Paceibacterota bacterium]